jgi:hypothetical protein
VTLLKVPGAIALGLLASLAAHAVLFGGGHEMGGFFHGLLVQAALAGGVGLFGFFGALAWAESNGSADGSILAARLRERLPSLYLIVPATTLWYGVAESIEPHHAAISPVAVLAALGAAAFVVLRLTIAIIGALARAVISVSRSPFLSRTPCWRRRARLRPLVRRAYWTRRRFARPPPIAVLRCA